MAEREFEHFTVRSGATAEGSRFTAWLCVTPHDGAGFPVYYAICENRSFRQKELAEEAAAAALLAVLALEEDGLPVFPDDYTGFTDEAPAIAP
jgi:hypothetical protein